MGNAIIVRPLPFTATASETAATYAAAYTGNDYAGVVWRSTGSAGPYLQFDLGADIAFDTVQLFGLQGVGGGATAAIRVATAAQGAGFGSFTTLASGPVLAGAAMPANGLGVAHFRGEAPVTARYVRIVFAGLGGAVNVARAVIGKAIQLERNYAFGAAFGVRDLGSLDFSARGVLLRRRAKKLRTTSLTFSSIHRDEVEALVKPLLEQVGNTELVSVLTDPDPDAQRQNRAYFGPLVGDLSAVHRRASAFEARTNVVSIF